MLGCDNTQYTSAVGDFGTACTAVVQQTKKAYDLVNDAVQEQQILTLARDEGVPDARSAFSPYVADETLNVRLTLLDGLQAYAATLGNLTDKTRSDLDSEATKVAGSLKELAKNDRLRHSFRETKNIPPEALNAAASGADALGTFLINRKIAARLPSILQQNAPGINAIASILSQEIGKPTGDHKGGLREVVWKAYDERLRSQADLVSKDRSGSPEKQHDLTQLAALVRSQHASDAALASTQSALSKLVTAHSALMQIGNAPATFKTVIADVWGQVKDAQDFYAKLSTK
jgi:hypothetical protein